MAESNLSQLPSVADRALPERATDGCERPGIAGSVEQLLNLQRVGVIMTPDPERPEEAWGVLNPASARSHDDELYLFPRVVAKGNYSRIALARVEFDAAGNPAGVNRLGLVLEPTESYEHSEPGIGGVEDPRITYIGLLDTYVMSYTALGPHGARIALAISKDLRSWDRLGLLQFDDTSGVDFSRCDNKDCVIFPLPVVDPTGHAAFAMLHRPIYCVPQQNGTHEWLMPPGVIDRRPSIWISYVPVDHVQADIRQLTHLGHHQLVAQPMGHWEHHHIGAGAPPILSEEGWLVYYHGVLGATSAGIHATAGGLVYQSGVMLLDRDDPRRILYRSIQPVLRPQEPDEQQGIVPDVVFPTAVDVRGERIDVYYGAADERIAAATTRIAASVLLAPSAPQVVNRTHHIFLPDDVAAREHWTTENPQPIGETLERTAPRSDRMMRPYGRILVALDGSTLAERVLDSVESLAQKFGSRVTLLRVITPVQIPQSAHVAASSTRAAQPAAEVSATETMRQEAMAYLVGVEQRLEDQGLIAESECLEGPPSEVILRRARQLRVDLIALTTHGRTGVDRLLLGSVAEDIVRRTPCPVHLVRVHSGR